MEQATGDVLGPMFAQLSLGGIFAILVLREVFSFLKSRKGRFGSDNGGGTDDVVTLVRDVKLRVDELHKWHDVRDEDQVPVWYLRKSLEREIRHLCNTIGSLEQIVTRQTEALEKLVGADDE